MELEHRKGIYRSGARATVSAFLRRHSALLELWRATYRPFLPLISALHERKKWKQLSPETRKFIRQGIARRARLASPEVSDRTRRVTFVNDLGFLYGAGIAQKRQADSFLLGGWSVSILAHQPPPEARYQFLSGGPKLDRRLSIRPALSGGAFTIAKTVSDTRPRLVIVGNIHAASWPVGLLSALRDSGATVVAYMHDCYWVTGRCAYPRSCERYVTGCDAACPTADEYPKLAPDRISDAWRARQECFTGRGAIPIVTNSRWTAQLARKRFPISRIDVIHLGLDHNLFAPMQKGTARRMLNLPIDRPIVVLGSLNINDPFKGGAIFRELCAMLTARPDICVAVIGKDSDAIEGARSFGLVDDERLMPLILNCADIYVSTAVEEAFGQMLLEAAACGVPAVAIEAGGVSDIVTDETGILVREKTAAALMTAIDLLLSDHSLRQKMGMAARARVEYNFTLAHQASAWAKYLAS